MKLILVNFGPSDEGLYNVEVQFENDGRGRGMLMLQFNIILSNEDTPTEMPNTGKLHTVIKNLVTEHFIKIMHNLKKRCSNQ